MRTRLVVNPQAGSERSLEILPAVNARLRRRLDHVDVVLTIEEGDGTRAAEDAVRAGYDSVVAVGGDGTLNEVLNGIAAVPGALDAVALGLIPLGTGNDFARAMNISVEPVEAAEAILQGVTRRVDVGRVAGRVFVNASAGGFVAETSVRVDNRLKTLTGAFAYLLGGAQALLEYDAVDTRVSIDDGSPLDLRLEMFAVSNGPYIGGGHRLSPAARVDDGVLDLCIVTELPMVEFVPLLAKASRGEHLDDSHVFSARARRLRIEFARPTLVNTDGQVFETTTCEYEVLPAALRMFAPADGAGPRSQPDAVA